MRVTFLKKFSGSHYLVKSYLFIAPGELVNMAILCSSHIPWLKEPLNDSKDPSVLCTQFLLLCMPNVKL